MTLQATSTNGENELCVLLVHARPVVDFGELHCGIPVCALRTLSAYWRKYFDCSTRPRGGRRRSQRRMTREGVNSVGREQSYKKAQRQLKSQRGPNRLRRGTYQSPTATVPSKSRSKSLVGDAFSTMVVIPLLFGRRACHSPPTVQSCTPRMINESNFKSPTNRAVKTQLRLTIFSWLGKQLPA